MGLSFLAPSIAVHQGVYRDTRTLTKLKILLRFKLLFAQLLRRLGKSLLRKQYTTKTLSR